MQNIADIRKDYTKASLDVNTVNSDPVIQFEIWFGEALKAQITEPNAMTLATVNKEGRPSARVVLLKGIENKKFLFYTNYQSRKGKELEDNTACALVFFWPELERQIRIEGIAERVDNKTSEQYFQSRPRGSQVGAWSSPQSAIIKDRSILEERVAQIENRFLGLPVLPKPNQWGGFQIDPFLIEFWQGRASRLHDRIEYVKVDGKWKMHRLAP
ncbi:pyridoxamine 5'-phosphate oxidase [Chryseosolibacter indicus]|uniref:Pyridoxine/pyridoxamine 5'-phosphate oxidase n=1 Tax=Chryseosolibacter indicus TaxID=2782351 RepID=A0ABS5VP99_9BACT|nr:pyridoxamine 5'-phosphate oxidase [Chryseosolibacter indicus]MBT1701836.1 pyridoxamine 5'-phosphate oxidase [Chryseosolibacter indicus]